MTTQTNNMSPLKGMNLVLVTIALSMATFMQMLDSTISNVAIPTIQDFLVHQQMKVLGLLLHLVLLTQSPFQLQDDWPYDLVN